MAGRPAGLRPEVFRGGPVDHMDWSLVAGTSPLVRKSDHQFWNGADASSEPGCSRDQKQPCPDDDGPDGSRDALTGRCHRAKVHDADDQEDRDQTGTAVAAVEA